jgi:hypothetical protein
MAVSPGGSTAYEQQIECRSGYVLTATSPDPDVTIWAKADAGDAFQNIESNPIALAAYAPGSRTFYFEIRAAADAAREIIIPSVWVRLP